jgi:ATP-dependent DNA helicase RecG
LDISTIKQMPKGHKPVKTFLIPENKRAGAYKFIDDLIARGQQTFVICPLIESSPSAKASEGLSSGKESLFDILPDDKKTVTDEIENLKKTVLGERKIAALHSRIKADEKARTMTKMSRGEIDILVSTSVVEVGVDIKNASVIVVEDAERFGLSQLHQFRGRVGRSDIQSYCFLFTKQFDNEKTRARLKAFVQSNDGFKLAELDLKQRGPGAILGLEQSGFKGLNPLWFENTELLEHVSKTAREIVDDLDKLPILKQKTLKQLKTEHLE